MVSNASHRIFARILRAVCRRFVLGGGEGGKRVGYSLSGAVLKYLRHDVGECIFELSRGNMDFCICQDSNYAKMASYRGGGGAAVLL